jgi:hypothetical protein
MRVHTTGILALTISLVSFIILALRLFRHIQRMSSFQVAQVRVSCAGKPHRAGHTALDRSEVLSIPVSSAKLLRRRYDPRLIDER